MSITVRELIETLETKDLDEKVEFIVSKENGELVCADVAKTAKDMVKVLKLFGGGKCPT